MIEVEDDRTRELELFEAEVFELRAENGRLRAELEEARTHFRADLRRNAHWCERVEQLENENEKLWKVAEAARGLLQALGAPRRVHIGHACDHYEVTYQAGKPNAVSDLRGAVDALGRAQDTKAEGQG